MKSHHYPTVALLSILAASLLFPSFSMSASKQEYFLYVGTYTARDSQGIYSFVFDTESGELRPLGVAAKTTSPSFLAVDSRERFLYAANETQEFKSAPSGSVSSFAIDRKTGKLRLLNQVASRGADPCHLSLDRTGKYLLIANYTGGNSAVLPVLGDGSLGDAVSVVEGRGALGSNKQRQETPHSHWIETSADNRFAYVADLGLDRLLTYRFDASRGTLASSEIAPGDEKSARSASSDVVLPAGSGPRHAVFSGDEKFLYVLGELDSTVMVLSREDGEHFRLAQTISALPAGFSGHNDAAEIVIHPNGKYLYSSNRGDDSIAEFTLAPATGLLTLIGHVSTQGKTPRHFEIDPTGRWVLVANQDSDSIVVFRIDQRTGKLEATGRKAQVPTPVCLKFVRPE
jgi:6-phosphogluconolactonase